MQASEPHRDLADLLQQNLAAVARDAAREAANLTPNQSTEAAWRIHDLADQLHFIASMLEAHTRTTPAEQTRNPR